MMDNKLSALVLTPFFSYEGYENLWETRFDPQGGMHLLVSRLCYGLSSIGVEQVILTMGLPKMPVKWCPRANITAYKTRIPIPHIKSALGGYHGLVKSWGIGTLLWVIKNRKKFSFDIIYAHCDGSGTSAFISKIISKILKIPLVMYIHSCRGSTQESTVWTEKITTPFAKKAETAAAETADVIYVSNDATVDYFRNVISNDKTIIKKTVCLPDADVKVSKENQYELKKKFLLPNNKRLILYVGRISSEKGCEHLIHLLKHIDCNKHHLIICGDGPEKEKIQNLADKLNVNEYITFTGFIDHDLVFSLIDICDVGIVPSTYEELGLVILEMMSRKLPVIAHDLPTVRLLITDNIDGVLVPSGNYNNMAISINRVVGNCDFKKKLVENAYKKFKKLKNIDEICNEVKQDFINAINKKSTSI